MEYLILHSKSPIFSYAKRDLEKNVSEKICDGWKPQGGASTVYDREEDEFILIQAMIKD